MIKINIMQKFILLLIIIINSFSVFSQKTKIIKSVSLIADTFKIKYKKYDLRCYSSDSIYYKFDERNRIFMFGLPLKYDTIVLNDLYRVTDSLAKNKNLCDKKIAHEIIFRITGYYDRHEFFFKQNNIDTSYLNNLMRKILFTDIKYCIRYFSAESFLNLNSRHLNNEVIYEIKSLLESPYRKKEEAELIINSRDKFYDIRDTIGYSERFKKLISGKNEERIYINKIKDWKKKASIANMNLDIWLDSMQHNLDQEFRDNYTKRPYSIRTLIRFIGQNKVISVSSSLEKYYMYNIEEGIGRLALKTLAGLRYKDYEETVVQDIREKIKNPDNYSDFRKLKGLFKTLMYINTQLSYYASADLLLDTTKVQFWLTPNEKHSIGAYFFRKLNKKITNFPWDEKSLVEELHSKGIYIYSFDVWDIDHYLPETFLENMHKWMVENKGNYKIIY